MTEIVSDTHAVVWFLFRSPRLSANASAAFNDASAAGHTVWVPSICLVEIIYLEERNRLPKGALKLLQGSLDNPRSLFEIAPLDRLVADSVQQVPRHVVPDMPDRIIAATAIALKLPLITADGRIRRLPITTIW